MTVTAQGLDATKTFTTETDGLFRFLNLAPGPYKVTAALQGFTTVVRENVIVSVAGQGQNARQQGGQRGGFRIL